jgi:hypothetical protein
MQSLGNSSLNLIRHYKFTFFDLTGEGPFTIVPVPDVVIQDSFNFSFNYSVTNSTSNTAKFTFYNLSDNTVGFFTSNKNRRGFTFDSWYANDTTGNTTIFKGLTYFTNTYRQGADIITEVTGCDVFLNLIYKAIFQKFPVGVTYLFVVQSLLSYYGNIMTLSAFSNQFLMGTYKSSKIFRGQILTCLKKIASDAGLIFSFQLTTISMIPANLSVIRPNATQEINAQNGLVGYVRPEALSIQLFPINFFGEQQLNKNLALITLSTLMRSYDLYSKVYVKSEKITGYYGIYSLTQTGEWRGNPWYSILKLWPDTNAG